MVLPAAGKKPTGGGEKADRPRGSSDGRASTVEEAEQRCSDRYAFAGPFRQYRCGSDAGVGRRPLLGSARDGLDDARPRVAFRVELWRAVQRDDGDGGP